MTSQKRKVSFAEETEDDSRRSRISRRIDEEPSGVSSDVNPKEKHSLDSDEEDNAAVPDSLRLDDIEGLWGMNFDGNDSLYEPIWAPEIPLDW